MKIGKTLYLADRKAWRAWLRQHYQSEPEIWLIFYNKASGKPRLPYNDAVEEALCYGWIDSIVKKIDKDSFAQRFSPRKSTSVLSDMNKERIRRLIKQNKMTKAGLAAIAHAWDPKEKFKIAADIIKALKADGKTWQNFQNFPESYRRIRVGFIEGARNRPAEFKKRLAYFIKMTKQNKRFGMVQ